MSVPTIIQGHDDLAALFSRHMTFNPEHANAGPKEYPADTEIAPPAAQPVAYSISQHYHHSTHAVKPQTHSDPPSHQDTQRSSSEPPQSDLVTSENILRIHGINPTTLTPSQLQLFRVADTPQRMRLLELWSICPPSGAGDISPQAWSSTTLEQEELMARMRFENSQRDHTMSLDGTVVQSNDSRWSPHGQSESEPYMLSGYEEAMRREREQQALNASLNAAYDHSNSTAGGIHYTHSTDPVYMGPDYARQMQQMEMANQYGSFEHFRGNGEVDAMDVM